MTGVFGLALLCASVLLLFYVARRRNSPNPPRWLEWKITAHMTLTLFLVGSLVGGSLMMLPFFQKAAARPGALEFGLALGVIAVTVVLWRLVGRIPKQA